MTRRETWPPHPGPSLTLLGHDTPAGYATVACESKASNALIARDLVVATRKAG